jgi:hypothetical protein
MLLLAVKKEDEASSRNTEVLVAGTEREWFFLWSPRWNSSHQIYGFSPVTPA